MKERLYTDYAEHYDGIYGYRDAEAQAEFVIDRFLDRGTTDCDRALVIGCGTGAHAPHLERAGFEVVGVDKYEPMLEVARRKSDATFHSGDASDLRPEGPFGLVVLPFTVVNYLSPAELDETLDSVRDRLAAGGVLVFDNGTLFDVQGQSPPTLQVSATESGTYAHLLQLVRVGQETTRCNSVYVVDAVDERDVLADVHEVTVHDDQDLAASLRSKGFEVDVNRAGYETGSPVDRDLTTFVASPT